jgi:hypothetical protein
MAARRLPRVAGSVALGLVLAAAACGRDPVLDEPVEPGTPLQPVSISATPDGTIQLDIPTYDGSGETVEPDVVHLAQGWRGWEYWMAFNPYPGSNEYYENASIVTSHDGISFVVPDGLKNPVIPIPGGSVIHNSDPDLVYVPQLDRLVLFYRSVTNQSNVLFATWSSDGIHWRAPAQVLEVPRHSLVSPAVVLPPHRRPKLFYVDSGRRGCEARETSVTMRRWMGDLHDDDALIDGQWSAAVPTDLAGPPGWTVWHLDVTWVDDRGEYWAIFPAYRAEEGCSHTDLFMARSHNGVTWEVLADPVLRRGDVAWADGALYRASLEYDAARQMFRVWFSAQSLGGQWRIGHETFPLREILDRFGAVR